MTPSVDAWWTNEPAATRGNAVRGGTAGVGPDRPNVLLLVMDTARARDVLGRPDVMPNLHRIAENGRALSNVFTTAPWTLPSHASMFTGQYTSDHGTHAGSKQFDPDVPPIAEVLHAHGYQTAAFSNNSWVSADFGFDRGFESIHPGWAPFDSEVDLISVAKEEDGPIDQLLGIADQLSLAELPATLGNLLHAKLLRHRYDDGALLTNWRIEQWLDRDRDEHRPFFAFVNYLEPHLEYRPPWGYREAFLPEGVDYETASEVNQNAWAYMAGSAEMDEREFEILHGLYRSELHYLDARIGGIYDALEERDELSNTVVFVVGDHGENVGDHGLMDHQYSLHDTLTHVPLVCHTPDHVAMPGTGEGFRELRDLYPTILDIAGITPPMDPSISQRSMLDPRDREYVIGEYVHPQPDVEMLAERVGSVEADLSRFDRGLRCIRTADWKYVEGTDGSEELYRVPDTRDAIEESAPREEARAPDTPAEIRAPQANEDVRDRLRELLYEERGELRRSEVDATQEESEVEAATQQRLEDLGYI